MKKIADKYGICILLIHHLRKQTASDPFDQISGSTGLMGVADTSWVMQRKRMSQTADILLTGRDMDDRTLHLREENCIWTLEDEETAEEREIKAVPDYLWKAAKYIESVGNWQGTASELLAAAGIENAKVEVELKDGTVETIDCMEEIELLITDYINGDNNFIPSEED